MLGGCHAINTRYEFEAEVFASLAITDPHKPTKNSLKNSMKIKNLSNIPETAINEAIQIFESNRSSFSENLEKSSQYNDPWNYKEWKHPGSLPHLNGTRDS